MESEDAVPPEKIIEALKLSEEQNGPSQTHCSNVDTPQIVEGRVSQLPESEAKEEDDLFHDCNDSFESSLVEENDRSVEENGSGRTGLVEENDSSEAEGATSSENQMDPDEKYLLELEKDMPEEEKQKRRNESTKLKEEGNEQFKKGEYKEAEDSYAKALQVCPACYNTERSILYSNRAAARMKQANNNNTLNLLKLLRRNPVEQSADGMVALLMLGVVKVLEPEFWRVIIGMHRLYKRDKDIIISKISSITVHSNYSKESYENDIALLSLEKTIDYNTYIQPICLPEASPFMPDNNRCYIAGWGRRAEEGAAARILQEAQVDIIPRKICNSEEWYAQEVKSNMLCAGFEEGGVDTCQGDSGGPLMCYFPEVSKYYLMGITSFGIGCGRPKRPGVYTRVPVYRKWIEAIVSHKVTPVSIPHVLIFWIVGWVTLYLLL